MSRALGDRARLQHMLDAAQDARDFAGTDHTEFAGSKMRQAATVRELMVLGEAAKTVSSGTRDRWPDFPWREMMRMRDVLTHHYHGVDLDIVWEVVTVDLAPVIAILPAILDDVARRTDPPTDEG